MTQKEALTLIYDADTRLLGEVRTCEGALSSILLTPHGEDVLGEKVIAWQTQGIPVGQERIQLREPEFARALGVWTRFMGYELVPATAEPHQVREKKKKRKDE